MAANIPIPDVSNPDIRSIRFSAHTRLTDEISQFLGTSPTTGINQSEAAKRLALYGENDISTENSKSNLIILLITNYFNVMNIVLTIAGAGAAALNEPIDAAVLFFVVFMNGTIGFAQEFRSEKIAEALKEIAAPLARVTRVKDDTINPQKIDNIEIDVEMGENKEFVEGHLQVINSKHVVIGDLIEVQMGDVVPADMRITMASNFTVDESLLTGESEPVEKHESRLDPAQGQSAELMPLSQRRNMAYKGTIVTRGRARGIVIAVGMEAELGRIAQSVITGKADKAEAAARFSWGGGDAGTSIKSSLMRLMVVLFLLALVFAVIALAAVGFQLSKMSVAYAVALAIAILPEGMPTVVAVSLAMAVRKLSQQNVLVRKMDVLDRLGRVTNICSDKTGTLTQGKMILKKVWISPFFEKNTLTVADKDNVDENGRYFNVEGNALNPTTGCVTDDKTGKIVDPETIRAGSRDSIFGRLDYLLQVAGLCSTAKLIPPSSAKTDDLKQKGGLDWKAVGDPTEIALQVFAHRLKSGKEKLCQDDKWTVQAEFPFDSKIKRMSVLANDATGGTWVLAKGSVLSMLGCCDDSLNQVKRESILQKMEEMASEGLRVLALARRKLKSGLDLPNPEDPNRRSFFEQGWEIIGLVGIYDPPRKETARSVRRCQLAGIQVHMATGDHWSTATSIARQIRILPADYNPRAVVPAPSGISDVNCKRLVWISSDFDKLTDQEIDHLEHLPLVIALCSPDTKVRLVRALHRRGKTVAMTGDGVNDAPAISISDVGISMGINGSQVTRQVSDITLTDDNFASILSAVRQGRFFFANSQKVASHFLCCNMASVIVLVIGLSLRDAEGQPTYPMSPIQILFLNMITSSPVAIALGIDTPPAEIMIQPPIHGGLFTRAVGFDVFFLGIAMGVISLANFIISTEGSLSNAKNCNFATSASDPVCEAIFRARSCAFISMAINLLLNGFNLRNTRKTIFRRETFTETPKPLVMALAVGTLLTVPTPFIPYLNLNVFLQSPLGWREVIQIVVGTLIYMAIAEIYKFVKRRMIAGESVYTEQALKLKHELSRNNTIEAPKVNFPAPESTFARRTRSANGNNAKSNFHIRKELEKHITDEPFVTKE